MALTGLLKARWKSLLIGVVAVYGLFLAPVPLWSVIWQSGSEVSVSGEPGALFCPQPNRCRGYYHFQVGNTGRRNQAKVSVRFPGIGPETGVSSFHQNIISSNPRSHDPRVNRGREDAGALLVEINDLAPGALVYIELHHSALTRRQLQDWQTAQAEVRAEGEVLRIAPRATLITRLFQILFGFWL